MSEDADPAASGIGSDSLGELFNTANSEPTEEFADAAGGDPPEATGPDPMLEPEPEATAEEPPPTAEGRLSTGIPALDRLLGGGIPNGRMVALIAPPETQGELLLKQLVGVRSTLYLSTFRPKWEIKEELADYVQNRMTADADPIDLQVDYVTPEELLESPATYLDTLPSRANLIIDSIDEFEVEDRSRYVDFLNLVKETLWETGSLGLFYGMEGNRDSPARSLTLKRSDLVWQLRRNVRSNDIEHYLVISKFRGGEALTEPVKLILTDEVRIDTSRDI